MDQLDEAIGEPATDEVPKTYEQRVEEARKQAAQERERLLTEQQVKEASKSEEDVLGKKPSVESKTYDENTLQKEREKVRRYPIGSLLSLTQYL